MNKKYQNTILAVVLGIALAFMVYALVSLLFDCIFMKDTIEFTKELIPSNKKMHETLEFAQNISIALTCTIAIMLVCYAFAYFGNGKIFNIAAAALSLATAVMAIVFLVVLRNKAHDAGAETYTVIAECFDNFIELAVSALLACTYFILNSVASFTAKKINNDSEEKLS